MYIVFIEHLLRARWALLYTYVLESFFQEGGIADFMELRRSRKPTRTLLRWGP